MYLLFFQSKLFPYFPARCSFHVHPFYLLLYCLHLRVFSLFHMITPHVVLFSYMGGFLSIVRFCWTWFRVGGRSFGFKSHLFDRVR